MRHVRGLPQVEPLGQSVNSFHSAGAIRIPGSSGKEMLGVILAKLGVASPTGLSVCRRASFHTCLAAEDSCLSHAYQNIRFPLLISMFAIISYSWLCEGSLYSRHRCFFSCMDTANTFSPLLTPRDHVFGCAHCLIFVTFINLFLLGVCFSYGIKTGK